MYQQQKRYNTAMDKFSDFKLGMASYLKRKKTGVVSGSSCNAFAIATFSSVTILYTSEPYLIDWPLRMCCYCYRLKRTDVEAEAARVMPPVGFRLGQRYHSFLTSFPH